ncbi:uncharacterized protein ACLA_014230 [Aspergillus clavatus NRRL 1]|uniref:Uncharacterized protein n=1 Tax=Aspergillus clavatus (strain ATCC 1007 / CBS 513.65 / DSM 816 / NCTC 3887 / NRRL 1 / QM 1276 / 107) TaxID=344612 RepID=A1CB68_ASPCL|nr:uncharacterized protein ACLA_014230 [Aspergillus clavatus NRRL 1]EAW12986.1 hypothetical protein ACLA_014230 [Aspergillus clavatus NRRL 1]
MHTFCSTDGFPRMAQVESAGTLNMSRESGDSSDLPSPLFWNTHVLPQRENDIEQMIKWDVRTLLERCVKQSDSNWGSEMFTAEQERRWLEKAEKVRTDLFNGTRIDTTGRHRSVYARTMITNLSRYERRIGKGRVVIIDGYEVSKESLTPVVEESVATSQESKVPQGRLVHELRLSGKSDWG